MNTARNIPYVKQLHADTGKVLNPIETKYPGKVFLDFEKDAVGNNKTDEDGKLIPIYVPVRRERRFRRRQIMNMLKGKGVFSSHTNCRKSTKGRKFKMIAAFSKEVNDRLLGNGFTQSEINSLNPEDVKRAYGLRKLRFKKV